MSIQKRLDKIEEAIRRRDTNESSTGIIIYDGDNVEEILKLLRAKYGENYQPLILKAPKTREEAGKAKTLIL